jgi:hypothetical protein
VWLVYVLSFGFSALLQREGYYLALGSLGICLVYASPQFRPRTARWMIFAGTLLGSLMLFGKPTGVIYLGLAVMTVLLLPRDADQPLRWRIRWTGAGLATAVVTMLALVAVAGSLRGYLFWHFRFPVAVYRFLEPVSWREVLGHGDRPFLTPALLTLIGGVVAVATRALPRHALAFAIGPVLHGAAALAQMKGWSYHFVPAVGSAYLFCILALVAVWTHPSAERSWDRTRTATTVAITLFLGRELVLQVQSSPWLRPEEKHLDAGESVAPRAAGAFIREHTRSTDRVYYYGNDPVLQFVAQRRPAGPYSYVLLLNYRYALDNHGELGPTPEQRADIERIAKQVQGDLCERLLRRPAAMVFTDGAQLGGSDGVADVAAFCLELRPLLDSDYHLAYNADKIRVFLRNESGTEPDL